MAQRVRLVLQKFDLLQLSRISAHENNFSAKLYFEVLLIGGALNPDLCARLDEIVEPTAEQRPNATWYLHRVEIVNVMESTIRYQSVRVIKNDILLSRQISGTFMEYMRLDNFPFDGQALTVMLALCTPRTALRRFASSERSRAAFADNRKDGPFPGVLEVSDNFEQGISFTGFFLYGHFLLREFLKAQAHEVCVDSYSPLAPDPALPQKSRPRHISEASVGEPPPRRGSVQPVKRGSLGLSAALNFRRSAHDSSATTLVKHEYAKIFPAVSVEAYVARKPNYVAYTVALPLCMLSLLSFAQFSYDIDENGYHRVELTVQLLLTSAAYRSSITASLPELGCTCPTRLEPRACALAALCAPVCVCEL
jgi:hypothetical protein